MNHPMDNVQGSTAVLCSSAYKGHVMDGQVGKMCTVFDSHESNLWLWSPCRATGGGSTAASSSSGAPQVSSGTAPTANASPAGNLGTSQGSGPSPAPSQPSNIFSECWERGCIICEGSRVYIWELHSYNAILQSENEKINLSGSFVFFMMGVAWGGER